MALEIKTAAELIALDLTGQQASRRAARETALLQHVFRAFVDRAGPIVLTRVVAAFPDQPPEWVFEALSRLDQDDPVRIGAGHVDLAYAFSAFPTHFVVDLGEGRGERCACCAVDALGMAPMLGQCIGIRSPCHDCAAPVELSAGPSGPRLGAEALMVWVGKRVEEERRACDWL